MSLVIYILDLLILTTLIGWLGYVYRNEHNVHFWGSYSIACLLWIYILFYSWVAIIPEL